MDKNRWTGITDKTHSLKSQTEITDWKSMPRSLAVSLNRFDHHLDAFLTQVDLERFLNLV